MSLEPVGGGHTFLGARAGSLCSCVFAVAGTCAGPCHMSQCRSLGVSVGANSWGLVCMGWFWGCLPGSLGDPGVGRGCAWVCRRVSLPTMCVDQGCGVFVACLRACSSMWSRLSRKAWWLWSVWSCVCTHVCPCFWVVALVCMLCVVGMSLWVCFGSACVSGACTCVGFYSVCGEAPVRRFSGTQLWAARVPALPH